MNTELADRLRWFAELVGLPVDDLLEREAYDELLEHLDEAAAEPVHAHDAQALAAEIRQHQQKKLRQLLQTLRTQIDLGALDRAEALFAQARRIGGGLPEFAVLSAHMNKARLRDRNAREAEQQLAEARALAGGRGFLPELRDARAVYESLLDRIELVGQYVDADTIDRELRQVERRIREEEARHSVLGTNAALDELAPNLEALQALEAMRARGETEVAISGAELTPIVTAIQGLEMKVRPKLARLIGRHFEDARRLHEERADPRAALTRLTRQRDGWRYLDEQLLDRLETFEAELAGAVQRAARMEGVADRTVELIEQGAFEEASRHLDVELARIPDPPAELLALRDVAYRQWLKPIVGRIRRLSRRVRRLATLRPEKVAELLDEAERLGAELADQVEASDEVRGLFDQVEDEIAYLERLDEVIELQRQGRLDDALVLLRAFGDAHRDFGVSVDRLEAELGARRSTEVLLAEIRARYRHDPAGAVEQAREHVGRDGRFAAFVDFALVERALADADEAEADGRYAEALAIAERAERALSKPGHARLDRALARLRAIGRDAASVRALLTRLERADEANRAELLEELGGLEPGRDLAPRIHGLLQPLVRPRTARLAAALAAWHGGEAVAFEPLIADARFIARHGRPLGDAEQALLDELEFARTLDAAADALADDALDEAERLAESQLGSRFAARAVSFLHQCKTRRALLGALAALGELDAAGARRALAAAAGDDDESQAAALLIDRIEPLLERLTRDPPDDPADAVAAFGRLRALVEEQPESFALRRLLERTGRRRLQITRDLLDACGEETGPGHQIERMATLTRDYEAAGRTEPEFAEVTDEVAARAPADLEALLGWWSSHADDPDVDLAALDRAASRLQAAARFWPDRPDLREQAARAGVVCAAARARRRDAEAVEALLERAREEGSREPLDAALAIEERHPDAPFGVAARLTAWRQADGLVARIAASVARADFEDASAGLAMLAALSRPHGLPHAATIRIEHPDFGQLGPGLDACQIAIDAEAERIRKARGQLVGRLDLIEQDLVVLEQRRAEALQRAETDGGETSAREFAARVGRDAEEYQRTLAGVADDVARLGLTEHVGLIEARLVDLRRGAVDEAITRRRADLDAALKRLNALRGAPPAALEAAEAEIRAIEARFPASNRIKRFVALLLGRA